MEDHTLNKIIRNYKLNPYDLQWFKDRLAEIYDEQDSYMMVLQSSAFEFKMWGISHEVDREKRVTFRNLFIFGIIVLLVGEHEIKYGSIVMISDDLKHDIATFYTFQKIVYKHLHGKAINVSTIIYGTDRASQHFENRFNSVNLFHYKEYFDANAEIHFHATSHGKEPCDGASNAIVTPMRLYEWAKSSLKQTAIHYCSKDNIQRRRIFLQPWFDSAITIPGTKKLHAFIPTTEGFLKMVDANIRVEWDLLPSYQNFTMSITKAKKREEHRISGISVEKITKAETDLILQNWNKLCQTYKLENKPKLFAQWKSRSQKRNTKIPVEITRRAVTALLADGLHRTLQQVYRHFISTFAYGRHGPYSPTEEVLMNICFKQYPNTITIPMLSYVMDREPRGLAKRFALFSEGNKAEDGDETVKEGEKSECVHWKLDNVEKLINGIMLHENVQSYHQLQNRAIQSSTWRSVAEDMGIVEEKLYNMWYRKVHVQLFVNEHIYSSVVQNKVIRILRHSKYRMWREISWKRIARKLGEGYTGPFVNRLVQGLASRYCVEYLSTDLKDVCAKLKRKRKIWKKLGKRLQGLRFNSKNELRFKKKGNTDPSCDKENTFMDHTDTKYNDFEYTDSNFIDNDGTQCQNDNFENKNIIIKSENTS